MNTIDKLNRTLRRLVLPLAALALAACADDIESGYVVNENAYASAARIEGMLLDVTTNRTTKVVELRGDAAETQAYFSLTKLPAKGVDVSLEVDADYVAEYNAAHNTEYALYPADRVTIGRDGTLLLAPDEVRSGNIDIRIEASDELAGGVTYLLPLKAVCLTEGISWNESTGRLVYLVKNLRNLPEDYEPEDIYEGLSPFKGEDAIKTVAYFDTKDMNPLNALEFVTEDGCLFIDHVVLFSANINYDKDNDRIYLHLNDETKYLLEHNEELIQPLRRHGIKVILSVLGNHDAAGLAQCSDLGARQFAAELASYIKAYNLDGAGFDDEYSTDPDLSSPLMAPKSSYAAARLLYEVKAAMPDKLVMVYYLGRISSSMPDIDGVKVGDFLDYAVADYNLAAKPASGMTKKDCAGMSFEMQRGTGELTCSKDYGYYMFFAMQPRNYFKKINTDAGKLNNVEICQRICSNLYGKTLPEPTHYYKLNYKTNSTERYPISELK